MKLLFHSFAKGLKDEVVEAVHELTVLAEAELIISINSAQLGLACEYYAIISRYYILV